MSEKWPSEVVKAAQRRDLVLVVGAGVSHNSERNGKRPLDWTNLLRELVQVVRASGEQSCRLDELINAGALLEAAELLHAIAKVNARSQDMLSAIKEKVDGPVRGEFESNEWHEALMELEARVIVTTNYDRLIERASKAGYGLHAYTSTTLGQEIRRADPVLIKIHGGVDNLEELVLTQTDYSRLHVRGRHALSVVQALFLTRVVLFVGYSLNDPDIRLLLQNCLSEGVASPTHYILLQESDEFQRQMMRDAFGVAAVEYSRGDHGAGLEMLKELASFPPSV